MGSTLATTEKNGSLATIGNFEKVLVQGDLSVLSEPERIAYYGQVCESVGLNPLTKPFEYLKLNGKLILYALKGCTDQLRKVHGISVSEPRIQFEEGLVVVSVTARDKNGREDSDIGAVALGNLQGEARANAIMKAISKAKRRVTMSICGLGMLDETEVETIPAAQVVPGGVQIISQAQGNRLWTIAKKAGHNEESARKLLGQFGFESFKQITTDRYDEICSAAADPELAATLNAVNAEVEGEF